MRHMFFVVFRALNVSPRDAVFLRISCQRAARRQPPFLVPYVDLYSASITGCSYKYRQDFGLLAKALAICFKSGFNDPCSHCGEDVALTVLQKSGVDDEAGKSKPGLQSSRCKAGFWRRSKFAKGSYWGA